MEVDGSNDHKFRVFIYEFFGTAFLIFSILVSGGNMWAVPFIFFFLIYWANPVTGAHFNPSLTIGVYIAATGKYK